MTQDALYLLPATAIRQLHDHTTEGLRFVLTPDEDARSFELLDDFDRTLGRSGRVLIAGPDRLELVSAAGLVSQPADAGRFLREIAEGPVQQALADLSPLRRLLPQAGGKVQAATLALLDDEGKTRARAVLRFLAGGPGADVALVLPRGLRGYGEELALLRGQLQALGTGIADGRQLRQHLLPDEDTTYTAKPEVGIEPEDTAFDVATDIILAYLPVMRANEPGIIADLDTEFLHDYRVALRKIRSVLSLFKGVYGQGQTADLKARFSGLMAPTGRLRDLDVYLIEQDGLAALVPEPLQPGLQRMFALFAAERQEVQARLARQLAGKGYHKDMTALFKLFNGRRLLRHGPAADRPAAAVARQLIWKRYRQITRSGAAITPQTPDAAVHALRIHCKKLRYLLEFFAPAFPDPRFGAALRPLKRLQDTLGLFNDYSVQQASLRDFVTGLDAKVPDRLDIAQSVGALIAALHARQLAERSRIAAGFAGFNEEEVRAIFRDLFAEEETPA